MKRSIVTLALVSIVATSGIARTDLARHNRNYPCPEYNHADQTCGVLRKTMTGARTTQPDDGLVSAVVREPDE
jgi:hypothetical protein